MGLVKTFVREGREEHEGVHKDFSGQRVNHWARRDVPYPVFLRVSSRPSRIAFDLPR